MRQRKQAGIFSSKASFLSIDMSNADTIELPEEGGVRMPLPKFALSGECFYFVTYSLVQFKRYYTYRRNV
jgi:hypothetical protein